MKESVKLFNALDGQKVSRETLEEIFRLAKVQKETALVFRIARILNENPEIDIFNIKLKKYPALNAPVYPTAIFDDGNLKPGYYFDNGHITTNTVEEFVALGIPELTEPIDEPEGLAKAVSPNEIYQYITDLILNTIKVSGHLPWQELWKESSFGSGMFATNFITKKHYRGINAFLLNYDVKNIDGEDVLVQKIWNNPYFMTFKQIQDKKGTLRKGSKGHFVVYFTKLYTHEETHTDGTTLQFSSYDKKKFYNWIIANQHKLLILKQSGWTAERLSNVFIPILKYYKIFNGEDIAGVDFGEIPKNPNADKPEAEKIEICETVLGKIPNPPKIYYRGNQPAYFPKQDQIEMTPIEQFINPQSFYCVLFHELTHSTGHSKRLDRGNDTRKRDGSPEDKKAYDFEELVAEMGAVFLCAETGILFQTRDQSAKYLKYYLDKLTAQMKDDNRFFFRAASAAQAASDYILDRDAEGIPAYLQSTKTTVQDPAKKKTISAKKNTEVKPKTTTPAVVKKTVPAKKPAKKITQVKSKTTVPAKAKASGIFSLAIGKISLDKARFQNRNKLNETVLQQIVENYSDTKLDPVIVWIDPKDKKTYLLAGHHRFEATLRVGRKSIPVKYFEGTEAEAVKYAKVESNANRSLELPQERAKIYREMIKSGTSKAKVFEEAKKLEGKNANYIINLAFLEPKGIVMQAIDSLSDTGDKQNATLIEKIADWIGEAKRKYELTPLHEKEMFVFLQDKEASKRFSSKSEFIQKITAIAGGFDFDKNVALNLKRLKYKSEGETAYDKEMNDLQSKLDALIEKRIDLKDRLKNPNNKAYVNPRANDYEQTMKNFDKVILKISDEIKIYQSKIIDLQRKKSQYTAAGSNQASLFGSKPNGQKTPKKEAKNTIKKPLKTIKTQQNKEVSNGQKRAKKPALKQPDIQQPNLSILPSELLPEVQTKETVLSGNKNTIAHKLRNRHNQPRNYYKIANDHIAKFLGTIEIKNKESVAITLTGGQGSMKTRFCFQLMNALAQHYKVGHASIEEHPESGLYFDKVEQYLNDKAIHNISAPEISSINDVHKLVRENDIIVIDSFSKLQEMDKNCELDKDFRKKYDGKLFIIIYQTTTDGKMRGGSKSQFDGDIILFIEKCANYKENYVWPDKNRYQKTQLDQLKYNIFHQKLQKETSEGQTEPETVSTPEVDTTKFSFNVK